MAVHVRNRKKTKKQKKIPALPRARMAGTRQRRKVVLKNSSFAESLPGWLSAKEVSALSANIFLKKN